MNKRFWGWAVLYAALAVAMLIAGHHTGASAHSWYSRTNCCSGNDCAPVPVDSGWVTMEEHGYRVTLTAQQARSVNPDATVAIDVFIPWYDRRIKTPPPLLPGERYSATLYDLCIPAHYNGVYCLFVAPLT